MMKMSFVTNAFDIFDIYIDKQKVRNIPDFFYT